MSRVALVTGGTRGIGAAVSIALHEAGYTVVANYGGNDAAANDFTASTGITVKKFNVSDFDETQQSIADIKSQWGHIEILINNAGITRDNPIRRMTFEEWNAVLQTDLSSCFNTSHAVMGDMQANGFGRIVNIGSVNGQAGQYGQVNYAAAKSGIHGFTKALAIETAKKNITANAIAPGYIDTDMIKAVPDAIMEKIVATIPVGRLGQPEEIARAVMFLIADDAGFMTGSTLSINGGQHMY